MTCWLKGCFEPGKELRVGAMRIILCVKHRDELESSAQNGYSLADPPSSRDRWWPWRELEPAKLALRMAYEDGA